MSEKEKAVALSCFHLYIVMSSLLDSWECYGLGDKTDSDNIGCWKRVMAKKNGQ